MAIFIDIAVKESLAEIDFNGKQFFFLGDIVGGKFGTGQGEEFSDENKGTYIPMWVNIEELSSIDVKPREVAEKIQALLK